MARREDDEPACPGCGGRGWKLRRSRRALVRATLMRGTVQPARVTCADCDGSGHAR